MGVVGVVDWITRTYVSGWAFDTDAPDRAVLLDIIVEGAAVFSVEANLYREDLKEFLDGRYPGAGGKHAFHHSFSKPINIFASVRIIVSVAGSRQVLDNGSRMLHPVGIEPFGNRPMLPLMVLSTGRAGSTLMMKRLASHPELVVAPHRTYEVKNLAYYAAAFRILVSSGDLKNSWDPARFGEPYSVGFNPYVGPDSLRYVRDTARFENFFAGGLPRTVSEAFRKIITGYYDIIRDDQQKPMARFFCEKTYLDPTVRLGIRYFFGEVREIVLIRDPRDTLCSSKSFWKQDQSDAISGLKNWATDIVRLRHQKQDDILFVRYEDLVQEETATLARIQAFVGLSAPFDPARDDDAAMFSFHATSASPAESIGRWRNDLNAETVSNCNALFKEFLLEFGYPQ